jgi:hypothetical protein
MSREREAPQPPKLLDQMRERIRGVQSPLDRIAA